MSAKYFSVPDLTFTREMEFTVPGLPMPKGSMSAVVRGKRAFLIPGMNRKRKDGTMSDGRERYLAWIRGVKSAAVDYRALKHVQPIDGPILLAVIFYLPRPKSTPKRVKFPATKPDLDKLTRAIGDCLNKILYVEDSRIVDCCNRKRFAEPGEPARAVIFLAQVDEAAAA